MVFLLHLDQPYRHVRHYVGAVNLDRPATHADLTIADIPSSPLLRAIDAAGITVSVARVWPGDARRKDEIQSCKAVRRLCPVCRSLAPRGDC